MQYSHVIFVATLLLSCGDNDLSEEHSISSSDSTSQIVNATADSLISTDEIVYTAEAVEDGPDGDLWIMQPGEMDREIESPIPDNFNVLEIIPATNPYSSEDYFPEMSYIGIYDFKLYEPFDAFEGRVSLFYDRAKTKLAAEWFSLNGVPNGLGTIYDLEGEIYLQKKYDKGETVSVIKHPYQVDWKFTQNQSSLSVNDQLTENDVNSFGEPMYRLSYSLYQGDGENNLFDIMEKESFENDFLVNDEVFTGTIQGYITPFGIQNESKLYDLHFKNGLLDGDIKIYNYWGDLRLHEVFVDGELDTVIYIMDESEMGEMAKPIIYLYPEKEMMVDVKLNLKGELTHTYPAYNEGWSVLARPDGTLIDDKGQSYYALYWEANQYSGFTMNEGFCVPGKKSAEFLEKALEEIGLNRREANEFIIYWLPYLAQNKYNLIHFSTAEYEDIAQLDVVPRPETMIRVMMVYQGLDQPQDIQPQNLSKIKKERKGFTVVEWGGSEVRKPSI